MGLLESVLNLGFVLAAGWFVIYYAVPKIQSGEFALPGLPTTATGGGEGESPNLGNLPSPEDLLGSFMEDLGIMNDIAGEGEEPQQQKPLELQATWSVIGY